MEKPVMCMREGERTALWTYAKTKLSLFRGTTGTFQNHQQSAEENTLCFASFMHQNPV